MGKSPATVLLLLLFAVAVRLPGLTAQSLWFDESVLVVYARMGFWDWLSYLQASKEGLTYLVKAPLLILVLRPWIVLAGHSEVALRVPFVLAGALSVVPLFYLCRRLLGQREALLAGLLLAANPMHVYYSQQVSEYGVLLLFGLLSLLAWESPIGGGRASRWRTAAVLVLNLFGLAIHPFHALIPALQVLLQLLRGVKKRPGLLAAQLGILGLALLIALLLATNEKYIDFSVSWIPPLGRESTMEALRQLSHGVMSHGELGLTRFGPWLNTLMALLAALAALGTLLQMRRLGDTSQTNATFLLVWLSLPVAAVVLISELISSVMVPRYFIILLPVLLMLVAAGLGWLHARAGWAAWALLAVLLCLNGSALHRQCSLAGRSMRELASDLRPRLAAGDGILLSPKNLRWSFGYHHDGGQPRWIKHSSGPDGLWFCFDGHKAPDAQKRQRARRWLAAKRRIWLVTIQSWPGDRATPRIVMYLDRQYEKRWHQHYPYTGADLILYTPRSTRQ